MPGSVPGPGNAVLNKTKFQKELVGRIDDKLIYVIKADNFKELTWSET